MVCRLFQPLNLFIFPNFQFYYPGQYENRAKELIAALYKEEDNFEVIETAVRFN
jgi:hypothetical protein